MNKISQCFFIIIISVWVFLKTWCGITTPSVGAFPVLTEPSWLQCWINPSLISPEHLHWQQMMRNIRSLANWRNAQHDAATKIRSWFLDVSSVLCCTFFRKKKKKIVMDNLESYSFLHLLDISVLLAWQFVLSSKKLLMTSLTLLLTVVEPIEAPPPSSPCLIYFVSMGESYWFNLDEGWEENGCWNAVNVEVKSMTEDW